MQLNLANNRLEGVIEDGIFALLYGLDRFDLRGNEGLDRSTIQGHLACSQQNLKSMARLDLSKKNKEVKLVGCIPHGLSRIAT